MPKDMKKPETGGKPARIKAVSTGSKAAMAEEKRAKARLAAASEAQNTDSNN